LEISHWAILVPGGRQHQDVSALTNGEEPEGGR
jgi:hypothetical protein